MSQPPRPFAAISMREADASLPALSPPPALGYPGDFPATPDDGMAGRSRDGRRLSAGLAWRAVRRHWWQALAVWAIGTAGIVSLVDRRVRPTFEAASDIRVEPGDGDQFRDGGPGGNFEVFKQTQARRVANPKVVAATLAAHPDLLRLPILAGASDPEAAVLRSMTVEVVPNTHVIRVAMTAGSPDGPARVVDAVIETFLATADDGVNEAARKAERLRDALKNRAEEVERKRAAIVALAAKLGAVDADRARDRDAVALDQYKTLSKQLLQTDLDLMAAQARLDQIRGADATADPEPAKIDAATVAAFYAEPQVAAIRAQVDAARDEQAGAGRIARNAADPARVAARKALEDGQKQLDALWIKKKPALERAARASASNDAEARKVAATVAELKLLTDRLNERLDRLNEQTRTAGADELTLEFARQDLARSEAVLDSVTQGLQRLEIEAREPAARFRQEFPARLADRPEVDLRFAALASAPAGMFLGVLGLVVLAELRAGRVVGPDDLPSRLRPRVLGVVPTLPRSGSGGGRGRRGPDFDRFVQSLDHLRVVLCDRRDDLSRRVLLITSACGGEGKTTLAAQLAERCVNAGLGTLLIDADLRNPSLGRMFGQEKSLGLADVLRGEATAEEAITVIGDAGGLHFLAAGTDRTDPGRLLHGDRLGRFLARARESFDVVIVDAPPVLPVPDALTIGRWVDGVVLAVRSDASRFPLVEQADQRLTAMGVPVLGAVVNGVRGAGMAYGDAYGTSTRGRAGAVTTVEV